jgi:RNA polymerase sigma-70 factor (ECF subfamily)
MRTEEAAGGERMADSSERAALLRLRNGSTKGLEVLVDRHGEELMRYLYAIVGNRDAAEDLFQETWIRVARGIHGFDPDRPFAPWLFRVARNLAYDHMRSAGRWVFAGPEEGEGFYPQPPPTPPDFAEEIAARDTTTKLLARLEPAFREVVALRFLGERSYQEMADLLGVPLGTVQSRLHRALDRLAEMVDDMEVPGR